MSEKMINFYRCPYCGKEYTVFEDMIACWKSDLDFKEEPNERIAEGV